MLRLFVGLLFLFSGASGLAYENVWIKQLGLVFGNTVTATTLVLTAFMGGLAAGSWMMGRVADRIERPLRVYGWLELSIAVAAFAFPWLLERVRELEFDALALGLSPWALTGLEFVALLGLFAVPTALMGATLPLLVRFAGGASAGRTLGLLYAVNSLGAVAGSLVTGFYLIKVLGLFATSFLAQVVNLGVGVAALVADRFAVEDCGPAAPVADAAARVPLTETPALEARWVLPGVFLGGFAAMLYEVALMKLLPLVLGSSVYSFALMVSAFITGIAIGSAVAAALVPHLRRLVLALGLVQLAAGGMFLVALPLFNYLPVLYAYLRFGLATSFGTFQVLSLLLCFLVMLGPTLALGAVLPLAAEALVRDGRVGAAVGRLYGVNTLGNILGTVLTGLVLVPSLGFKGAMEVGVCLNLASGCALVRAGGRGGPVATGSLGAAAVLVSAYLLVYPQVDTLAFSAGVFRAADQPLGAGFSLSALKANRTIVFAREDATSFVTVEDQGPPRNTRSLRVNGKVDASNGGDMGTQKLLAHLPLLFHPAARQVFVIGLGSGVTVGAALAHQVDRVEAVEISPAVAQAARLFAAENNGALDDPRVALAIDDGRVHLERSARKYDVIISEPSNPWMAGITNLFSVECFRIMRDHLAGGGVVSQWLHAYEMDPETFRLVLRTFRRVFPHVVVFSSVRTDVILLGSMEPLAVDFDAIERRMAAPAVAKDLRVVGIGGPLPLFLHYLARGPDLDTFIGPGEQLNTDDWPVLEYTAPIGLFARQQVSLPDWERRVHSPHSLLREYLRHAPPKAAALIALVDHAAVECSPEVPIQLLRDALADEPANVQARRRLAEQLDRAQQPGAALVEIEEAARLAPDSLPVQRLRYQLAFRHEQTELSLRQPRRFARALEAARACVLIAPRDEKLQANLGGVLYDREDWREAEQAYREALALSPGDSARVAFYHFVLASCRLKQGDVTAAAAEVDRASAAPGAVPEAEREFVRILLTELELARRKPEEGSR